MGDTTALQATVYACPAVERVHVAEILAEYFGPGGSWDDVPAGGAESVALGEQYLAPEVSCGSADELGDKLAEVPGISFVLWEDPKYEWLGDVRAFTPELGLFAASCDANGTPVLAPAEIMAIIAKHDTKAEIVAAVGQATGKPWFDACDALDPRVLTGAAAITRGCEACGAEPGEECRPMCIGQAAHQDETGEDVTS